MLRMNDQFFALKWTLKKTIARYPLLFFPISKLRSERGPATSGEPTSSQLVSRDTQLVIEGFQRTGNTFAVRAFQYAQPNPIKIAYHFHAPAQILRAVKLGIPTLVVIRNPKDAVASYVARWPVVSISRALELYVFFYESIEDYKSSYIIGEFEEVTQNYSKVIQKINAKFGTNFVPFSDSKTDRDKVLEEIVVDKSSFSDKLGNHKKETLLQEILHEKHSNILRKAETIYQEFVTASREAEQGIDKSTKTI